MSITNGYATLAQLREALYEGTTQGTDSDSKLERAVESASRKIETYCGRRFWADSSATARVFRASTSGYVRVDDCWSVSTVEVDLAAVGTWTTVAASAQQLEPLNALRDGVAWAYTAVRLTGASGAYFPISGCQALVRVTAKWGWPATPDPIREACIIQGISVLAGPKSQFGVAGVGDMGVIRIKSGLHPTAQLLVADYARKALVA